VTRKGRPYHGVKKRGTIQLWLDVGTDIDLRTKGGTPRRGPTGKTHMLMNGGRKEKKG